jgi:hypothetical protein
MIVLRHGGCDVLEHVYVCVCMCVCVGVSAYVSICMIVRMISVEHRKHGMLGP